MTGTAAAVASPVDFGRYGDYTVKRPATPDGSFQRPVYPFTGRITGDGASSYRPNPAGTISTSPWPARGRTAASSCGG